MKYIRTKDGRIVDIEKFINEEKDIPYYKDFIFEEITKDGVLKWTAVGTEQNSMEEQRGIRCHFSASLNSEVIKQADTIEELCDAFIDGNCLDELNGCFFEKYENKALWFKPHDKLELRPISILEWNKEERTKIKGAIWTDKGLIYVSKMNEKGELELL